MHSSKVLFNSFVTHDVKRFILEKPEGYQFTPGQATLFALNKEGWKEEKRPFTFTSLNEDEVLELIVKGYDPKEYEDHDGMTKKLHQVEPGDELLFEDPWGTINYEGLGVFIAGGAGVTPFIAILRELRKKDKLKGNKLFFSNKEKKDIILEKEFKNMFDEEDVILTLTREEHPSYHSGRIDEDFLKKNVEDFSQNFYVCGPPPMVKEIKQTLSDLGANSDSIVFEE